MLFFRRPRMMHPIHLLENFKLTLAFNLKLVGQLNPLLHPFFESVNPGFKVYIGDYLLFDYVISGELDDVSSFCKAYVFANTIRARYVICSYIYKDIFKNCKFCKLIKIFESKTINNRDKNLSRICSNGKKVGH